MNQSLTTEQRSLSKRYLGYKALTNLWFVGAVWLYFYRLFVTDQQVGILDGFAFAVGLIAEVPSGALADRFGRDRIVKLGQLLVGIGFFTQALGSSFVPFFVGQSILMIGVSFMSGADEALFFERFKFEQGSSHWRKLVTRGAQVALVASLLATIAGGWLQAINPRIPWFLTGTAFLISIVLIWSLKDTRPERRRQSFSGELKENLANIHAGFKQFLTPKLWLYVPFIIAVQGLFYSAGWGILRIVLLDRFHFEPFWGSVVIATSSLITVGILALMHRYAENLSEKRILVLISFASIGGLLLSLADIGVWGYVVMLTLYAGEHVLYPFMSEVLNNRTETEQRATVLSVASFLRTLPYVALAPIIGYLNTQGNLKYFFIGWSVVIFIALLIYIALKKKDDVISMAKKDSELEKRVPEISG